MNPDKSNYKSFTDKPFPPILYVDTSFIVEALISGQPYHEASLRFIEALSENPKEQPILIFSDLLRIELKCAVIKVCIRNDYGKDKRIDKILKREPDLFKKYYSTVLEVERQLDGVLARFVERTYVPISENIIIKAGMIMSDYRLGSADAIHIATMEEWGIQDIVTYDWGIVDLPKYKPGCRVWTKRGLGKYKRREKERALYKEKILKPEKEIVEEAEQIVEKEVTDLSEE